MLSHFKRILRPFKSTTLKTDNRQIMLFAIEELEDRVLLNATLELAGGQTIVGGTNLNVSNDGSSFQSEISLAINPMNPLNIAGFSHNIGGGAIDVDLYSSMDGGVTWTTNTIDGSDDGTASTFRFDPSIAFDATGNLYVAYGMDPTAGGPRELIVARSTDGGATLDQFTTVDVGTGLDKWHLATGLDPSTGNQAIYITYVQFVASIPVKVSGSNDAGATFSAPVTINDDFGSDSPQFADPAVGPNGELFISWTDRDDDELKVDVDFDGLFDATNTFGTDTVVTSWTRDLFKTLIPGQPERGIPNGPVIDIDRSGGANHGNIYIAYADVAAAADPSASVNIYLVRSTDNGLSWSSPILVDDGTTTSGTNSSEFLPWLDIDQTTGSVNVIYYSTQGDEATGNDNVNARLASSIDGGLTYTESNLSTFTTSEAGGYGGDYLEYIGLAVHDGTAHGLWSFRPPASTDLEAFTASASFQSASGGNKLTVTGDDGGTPTDDTIVLQPSAANANFIEVIVNGVIQFAGLASTIDMIEVKGFGGDDTITSFLSHDVIMRGGFGNDTLIGGFGDDQLFGNSGDDTLRGEGGNDTVFGVSGNDKVSGNAGNDILYGGTGNDLMFGGLGDDILIAFFGDDVLHGQQGADILRGGGGNDRLFGGIGSDTADGDDRLLGGKGVDFTRDFYGDDTHIGGQGNDTMRDARGNNALFGNSGHDVITGGVDGDTLIGGDGKDRIKGFGGSDRLVGNSGNDTMFGDDGDDRLLGGLGNDTLAGGSGNDTLLGQQGSDNLTGGLHDDLLFGGLATDTLDGNDILKGGDGNDYLRDFYGNDRHAGGFGDDTVRDTRGNNQIFGNQGNDTLIGGLGDDLLRGGDGEDLLKGRAGNDRLDASAPGVPDTEEDDVQGGSGFDTAVGQIDLMDTLTSIENDLRT